MSSLNLEKRRLPVVVRRCFERVFWRTCIRHRCRNGSVREALTQVNSCAHCGTASRGSCDWTLLVKNSVNSSCSCCERCGGGLARGGQVHAGSCDCNAHSTYNWTADTKQGAWKACGEHFSNFSQVLEEPSRWSALRCGLALFARRVWLKLAQCRSGRYVRR